LTSIARGGCELIWLVWSVQVNQPYLGDHHFVAANLNNEYAARAHGGVPHDAGSEAAPQRAKKSPVTGHYPPSKILETIEQHVLLDGFQGRIDLDRSRGSYLTTPSLTRQLLISTDFRPMPVDLIIRTLMILQCSATFFVRRKSKSPNSGVYSEGYAGLLWRPSSAWSVCLH